ncbi:hypothetical protein [Salinigranum salinum]|uniref:hypothetical protein n=1 Tax=Salinigranum salinum TaxID=1364937 RepID=UPI0012604AF7|nr:hypothetical protein [Salinigranum salinum]
MHETRTVRHEAGVLGDREQHSERHPHLHHDDGVQRVRVPDGNDLIQRTYHELTDGTTETDASRIRFGELDTAFR